MQYPCEYCQTLCKKNQVRALCSLECRMLGNIKKVNGCWIWQGKKNNNGYGEMMINSVRKRVHRIAFEYFNKRLIEPGKFLCHTCDIPACINPKHLFEGTQKENLNDMVKKDRSLKGEKNPSAKFSEHDILRIRKLREWNLSVLQICELYNMSKNNVYRILKNKSWKLIELGE